MNRGDFKINAAEKKANMNPTKKLIIKTSILSLLAAVVTALAWQSTYLFFLQLIGFVPFFYALYSIRESDIAVKSKIGAVILSTFLFRVVTLTMGMPWLMDVSVWALVLIVFTDATILSLFFMVVLHRKIAFFIVVPLFLLFEYCMQNLLMLAPFYLIGYSWSVHVPLIQYYSVFGVEGGSVMIYMVNYALFSIIKNKEIKWKEYATIGVFGVLTAYSLISYYTKKDVEWNKTESVSIVHSEIITLGNKDYLENPRILVNEFQKVTKDSSLVILPENFFASLDWYEHLQQNTTLNYIDSINEVRNQRVLAGALIYKFTNSNSPQSRIWEGRYYNTHNVSILRDNGTRVKSKVVFIPFYEYVPSNTISQLLNRWIPIVGDDRKIEPLDIFNEFWYKNKRFDILLCYGSIFPLLVAERSQDSYFLTVQANENWHHSHTCSYQYLNMNKANTIAVGVPTYRSSNYGYSAFIKPNGDAEVLYKTNKKFSSLIAPLPQNATPSFYTNIAGYSYYLSGMVLFSIFASAFFRKTNYNKPD